MVQDDWGPSNSMVWMGPSGCAHAKMQAGVGPQAEVKALSMRGLISIDEATPHIMLLHDIQRLFTISMGALSGQATMCAIGAFNHCKLHQTAAKLKQGLIGNVRGTRSSKHLPKADDRLAGADLKYTPYRISVEARPHEEHKEDKVIQHLLKVKTRGILQLTHTQRVT